MPEKYRIETEDGSEYEIEVEGETPTSFTPPPAWSERIGVKGIPGVEQYVDYTEGFVSGIGSTAVKGGDLIRRGLGLERIIDKPEAQQLMRPPGSFAGQAGKLTEGTLEFAVPAGAVSKATAGARLLTRMGAEAATGAGVAGVQSGGDPLAMGAGAVVGGALPVAGKVAGKVVDVAKRAAAGAQEGGLGGAVASVIRSTVPQTSKATMVQALKPRLSKVNFERSLDQALPEMKAAEAQLGKPIENLADLVKATKTAKDRVWDELDTVMAPARNLPRLGGGAKGLPIDLTPVANSIESTITKTMRLEDPAKVKALTELAKKYRKRFSIQDAEDFLHETNAELAPFYSKLPADQQRVIQSGASQAQLEAKASALRKAIDDGLDRVVAGSGDEAKRLRRLYGSLMEVNEEAVRRANVAARQQPESLSEQLAGWSATSDIVKGVFKGVRGIASGSPGAIAEGAADILGGQAKRAASKFIKEQQTTDALIKRAMKQVGQPWATLPPPP